MRKGTHKVSFTAEKPMPTRVSFETKDGKVSFIATKEQPQKVAFWAKDSK